MNKYFHIIGYSSALIGVVTKVFGMGIFINFAQDVMLRHSKHVGKGQYALATR